MSSEHNLLERRPWWHISRKLPRNPFDPLVPKGVDAKLEYCRHCQMDVDVQIEAANADGVDVYRKRCKRCGSVIQHGIAQRFVWGSRTLKPFSKKVVEFIQSRGRDRR